MTTPKLLLIPLLAICANAQPLTITDKTEIAIVSQHRANVVKQECFNALRACPDTNAVAKATATLKAATPARTNAGTINSNPAGQTTK